MLNIITEIPIWVWPLFFILLLGGLKARKTSTVPLTMLLLIPSVFFTWGLFSFYGTHACHLISILLWLLSLALGFCVGFIHMQKLDLRFDKQQKKVQLPGSWIPLILSMAIFTTKFTLGMLTAMHPNLIGSLPLLSLELFSTFIAGIFAGRGISCLIRFRSA
jgi:hypothetical protein